MFARTGPRMGVRFASGNVFYMNRTFTMRHLQSVASPLSNGFITPLRLHSSLAIGASTMWTPMGQSSGDLAICESMQLVDGSSAMVGDMATPMTLIDVLGNLHMATSLKLTSCVIVCTSRTAAE
jgi:hypothetical protein